MTNNTNGCYAVDLQEKKRNNLKYTAPGWEPVSIVYYVFFCKSTVFFVVSNHSANDLECNDINNEQFNFSISKLTSFLKTHWKWTKAKFEQKEDKTCNEAKCLGGIKANQSKYSSIKLLNG